MESGHILVPSEGDHKLWNMFTCHVPTIPSEIDIADIPDEEEPD